MLVQITDPHVFCPLHLALVRHELAGNDVHKGGLSFAVSPNQADVLTL